MVGLPESSSMPGPDRTSLIGDCIVMARLRASLSETDPLVHLLSDDEVIDLLAARVAAVEPGPPITRPMSGYFGLLKYVLRSKSFEHLEKLIGYRPGRLSAKGLLIYRFLRVPEIHEFEVRGYSNTPAHEWKEKVAPARQAQLAASAPYHQATKVPNFDEVQRRNARETMALSGDNTLIRIYPREKLPIDSTKEGYPAGEGIAQWELTEEVSRLGLITGWLLFQIRPGDSLPWVE